MKCIYGIYSPDAGLIKISGEKVEIENPRNAMDLGISMIHQELHPVRTQNVSENIFLGRLPYKKRAGVRWVDRERLGGGNPGGFERAGQGYPGGI